MYVSRSIVSDSATLCTVARQVPLSAEFSRQEYWCGLPFPSPGDLLDPGIEPRSPALQEAHGMYVGLGENCDKKEGTDKVPLIWGALGILVHSEATEAQGWLRGGGERRTKKLGLHIAVMSASPRKPAKSRGPCSTQTLSGISRC